MADLARYVVKLEAETARYTRELERANRKLDRFEKNNKRSLDRIKRSFNAFGAAIAAVGVGQLTRSIASAGLEMERFERGLKVATGSQEGAAREMEFLRETADELGLNLQALTREYVGLAVASKGTALEGKATRDIFVAVSEAAAVLGMSAEQTGGALNAIQQMMSKGKVSAEELRGQLGERLFGAFQAAADAVGKTTAELDKMLAAGELTAEELLPKLARELHRTFGPEVAEAANSAQGSINKLNTSLFEMKVAIADSGVLDAIANLADGLVAVAEHTRTIGEDLARFFGAGTPMDQAAERIEHLQQQIEDFTQSGVDNSAIISVLQAEIDTLRPLVELHEELVRGREQSLGTGLSQITIDAESNLAPLRDALDRFEADRQATIADTYDRFVEHYATAEQEVAAEMDRFDVVAHLFPAEEQERIREAIRAPLFEGLEMIEIQSSKVTQQQIHEMLGGVGEIDDAARELGLTFSSAFEDAIVHARSLEDIIQGLLQDITRMLIRRAVTEPFIDFFDGLLGSIGGGGGPTGPLGPPRAAGGPVSAGVGHLVGEQGPELFVPNVSGRIVPNHGLGGGVTIVQHNQAGLPPQWQAQMLAFTNVAAAAAKQSVARDLGGRR